MSKDYVTVSTHRRAFPKRKFADGGASTDSDRPDLVILAKQGLSPSKPPGMPPRIVNEFLAPGGSEAWTGGDLPVLERASKDEPSLDRGKSSVLSQMMDTAADRVQRAHDNARAAAALKAFHDSGPSKHLADGGPSSDPDTEAMGTALNAADRVEQAHDDARAAARMKVIRDALTAAGNSNKNDFARGGQVDRYQSGGSLPFTPPAKAAREPADDAGEKASYPDDPSPSPAAPPTPSGGSARTGNSPRPPAPIDWRSMARESMRNADAANNATTGRYGGFGSLAQVGGTILGKYLKHRGAGNQLPGGVKMGPPQDPLEGIPVEPYPPGFPSGEGEGDGGDIGSGSSGPGGFMENAGDLGGQSADEGFGDLLGMNSYAGGGPVRYARGGDTDMSPGQGMRRSRPMRPASNMGAPGGYTPPPGSAANFPGGGPGGSQFGQMPAGPQAGGMPPGGGLQGTGAGALTGQDAYQGALARSGMSPGNFQSWINQQGGTQIPGGPPPTPGGPQFGGGPSPGRGPGGGLPPGLMGMFGGAAPGASGPPPGGPPPSGPPPGGPPPGGPPGGMPPGGAQMGPLQGSGMPPGGPPPGMGGPPPGMGGLPPGMGGPLPGGSPPGPPPGAMGPPPGGGMQPVGNPNSPWAAANFPGSPNGPPPGGGQDARMQQAALQAALAQRAGMGGPLPAMKKGGRVRQFGGAEEAAEDLPPAPEKKKKGGVIRRRPTGKKKVAKGEKLPVPMVTDDDMDQPPPPAAPGPSMPPPPPTAMAAPPPGPPPGGPPMGMAKGGVAKLRRGYPNTNKKPKKMASGGSVRGCGVATKGKHFSGIY